MVQLIGAFIQVDVNRSIDDHPMYLCGVAGIPVDVIVLVNCFQG